MTTVLFIILLRKLVATTCHMMLIMNLSLRNHVIPALKQLHWLPVHHVHIGQTPQYLSDC